MSPQKTALVIGGSRGIGAATAERLARDGFAVALSYTRNAAEADAVAARITAAGGQALIVQADISTPSGVQTLMAAPVAAWGGLDVVVLSAGVFATAPMVSIDDATIDRLIATNLTGAAYVLRAAAGLVRDGGRIITLSTSVVGSNMETYGLYAATKAAVETLTRILSKELRGRQITVNAVAPGPTATDLFLTGKSPELVERLAKMPPLERLGTPDDIAAAIAFLAGPDGGWINGQILRANGGLV